MQLGRTAKAKRHGLFMPLSFCKLSQFGKIYLSLAGGFLLLLTFVIPSVWARGELQNVSIIPTNDIVGVRTTYQLSFLAPSGLPNDGKILIFFPAGFDISGAGVAGNATNLNGGIFVNIDSSNGKRIVILERDSTGSALASINVASVKFSIVVNPTAPGDYVLPSIVTQDSNGNPIDQIEDVSVTIKAGALDHFTFSLIDNNQTAGAIQDFIIDGKDAFGNIVEVNESVFLTDNTGTLTPKKVTMSDMSFKVTNARITKAQNDVIITARGETSDKSGISNSFDVGPGNLSKFSLSPIPNPLIAGSPFTVTITAQDSFANTVTSFSGSGNKVNFLPADEIQPAVSGDFLNGIRNELIAYRRSGINNKTITVKDIDEHEGTSNNFTVNPGKPSGTILFTVTPKALPADENSTARIVSTGPIKDAQGNNVGNVKLFNVSVNDTTLGSITTDADPTISGKQIATNPSSFLDFNFKAGKKGGAAIVLVTSVDGAASGSANISVNQLKILAIETTPDTVSQDQTDIPVNMIVQNFGVDTVQVDSARLTFSRAGYSGALLLSKLKIPGYGGIQTLRFLVEVDANAPTGEVTIDGRVYGKIKIISSNVAVSDTSADTSDRWTVQTRPMLSYDPNSLDPDSVNAGASYQFSVGIRNNGEASITLNSATTIFRFTDGSQIFTAALDQAGSTELAGSQTTTLSFQSKQISPTLPKIKYSPQVILNGTQNGSAYSNTIDITDSLRIFDMPVLQILDVTSSQDIVTQGMNKAWDITLHVQNNSSLTVDFHSASLQFLGRGTSDPDSFYSYKISSEGFPLKEGGKGNVVFQISKTGQSIGDMAVFAKVTVKNTADTTHRLYAESNGTQKTILVQTPANLSIDLRTSQAKVTQGQAKPYSWQVIMKATNSGESAAKVSFVPTLSDSTRISFTKESGYQVTTPTTNVTIPGKDSIDIVFNVEKTGAAAINKKIDGQLFVREINSGSVDSAFASTQIAVQSQASIAFDATQPIALEKVYNGDSVNIGQQFQVRVKVQQTKIGPNVEKVDSVRIKLIASNNRAIVIKDSLTLKDLGQPLYFDVKGNVAGPPPTAQLTATIRAAYSANTGANTVNFNPNDKPFVSVNIQRKGQIQFGQLTTSTETVRRGTTTPRWYIYVPIKNIGGGTLEIQSSRVTVTIGGQQQNDYKINAPGRITLAAGQDTTLEFEVQTTGYTGGTATLTAILDVLDKNSNTTSPLPSGTGTIIIDSSALVRIYRTDFFAAANRVPQSEIALVDTGQDFDIEVTVENTGLEVVDTAYVSLTRSGNSTLLTTRAKAVEIATNNGRKKAIFRVRAAGAPNPDGETFIARLDSAVTRNGMAKASIGSDGDSIAVARIQLPARLQLSASTDAVGNLLTIKQRFTLYAVVKNLGQSETDNNGILRVTVPDTGFKFITPPSAQQSVTVGDTMKWIIRAPLKESTGNLIVTMSPQPRSKNTNRRLFSPDSVAMLQMKTLNSLLMVDSTLVMEPQGARDKTVSTEQFFIVEARISASEDLINRTATLTLPSGYNLNAGESVTKSVSVDGKVNWVVQAPVDAAPNPANLQVKASATDGQSQTKESQAAAIAITTQRRALLNLTAGISEPAGARNGMLSVGQPFTISAILANTGQANLQDTTIVELALGATRIAVKEDLKQMVIFKPDSQVKTITWSAVAPQTSPGAAQLTFRITRLPVDENTNKFALAVTNTVFLNVSTVARGTLSVDNLRISSPPGAQDNELSTDQDFIVSDALFWTNATQLSAQLMLPENFITDNATQFLPNVEKSGSAILSWRVRASSQAVANDTIRVVFSGKDASNDTSALAAASNEIRVKVVNRADPRLRAFISNPPTARDGVISLGQLFEVTAVIENNGEALLSDTAKVSIKVPRFTGYTLPNSQDTIQASTGGKFSWWVRGRSTISEETDLMALTLEKAPRDVNTNQPAASTQSVFQLAVRTEGKKLVVENLQSGGGPAFRGEKDLLLMRLKLTNPAGVGSSSLALRTLQISLQDRSKRNVVPYTALKAIRIVNAQRDTLYGEINDISESSVSPLAINFVKNVVTAPNQPDTIAILGDIGDNATAPNFRLVFDNGQDFTVEDQDGGNFVVVENNEGKSGADFRLESNLASLFDAESQNSFYNYPNPLQPQNRFDTATYFAYNLPEASDGELKIFTLLGEPVWEISFAAADAAGRQGPHKTDLSWDGFNGDGKKVLNGVYVAILKTKFGKAMAKVAVAK